VRKKKWTQGKREKKNEKEKVPPRFELGFRDSESLVLTATLWNQLRKGRYKMAQV
jgi:hypothetical protein